MIGGTDIIIHTAGGNAALDICLRVIRRFWPQAVFEEALTGQRAERYELLSIGCLNEVLAYQSAVAAHEWDVKGAEPALRNTMIHLLLGEGSVTAVVDDPEDKAIRPLLESLRFALRVDILNLFAERPERKAA